MKNYLVIVSGNSPLNVSAHSKEDAINRLPESEQKWVVEVIEL